MITAQFHPVVTNMTMLHTTFIWLSGQILGMVLKTGHKSLKLRGHYKHTSTSLAEN